MNFVNRLSKLNQFTEPIETILVLNQIMNSWNDHLAFFVSTLKKYTAGFCLWVSFAMMLVSWRVAECSTPKYAFLS